jgi:Zn-dependent protease with chaperone function
MQNPSPTLQATYFDGKSAQAHGVALCMDQGVLHIVNANLQLAVPVNQVEWPERTRHGKRMALLAGGGSLQCADGVAWDAWCKASGLRESGVVVVQQSWRWVAAALFSLVLVLGALYQWGLPMLAQAVVAFTPQTVDAKIGQSTLAALDEALMAPSGLELPQQEAIRTAFVHVLQTQAPDDMPQWNLAFRKSKIGPNALALPGGTLLMTDDMVALVGADTQVLMAVLAHELGHAKYRHGLRMLVQVSVLGAITSLVLGDFSTALAAVPALLGQAHYSREAEREADAYARQILVSARISPRVMVTLLDRLRAQRERDAKNTAREREGDKPSGSSEQIAAPALAWLGLAFASHPADAERIAFFQGDAR